MRVPVTELSAGVESLLQPPQLVFCSVHLNRRATDLLLYPHCRITFRLGLFGLGFLSVELGVCRWPLDVLFFSLRQFDLLFPSLCGCRWAQGWLFLTDGTARLPLAKAVCSFA